MLVLQCANNRTLNEYLESMRKDDLYQISWNNLIRIAKGITNGLAYLHKKGVIHRDLPKIVDGTPPGYSSLFVKCWSFDPNERPSLNEISSKLEKLSTESTIFITNLIALNQITEVEHQVSYSAEDSTSNSRVGNNSSTDIDDNKTISK
ncbi:7049_t:CDS:2 [Cetraspora pellucida]|uniref:7049_t:CDS:1 n=1 Tax=Cetraspora pellucida TaxID=1433469 RepID=A0ACA9LHS1_9GLOM|nr:7049_t:CDS:2 [Cetraspora pellucida]